MGRPARRWLPWAAALLALLLTGALHRSFQVQTAAGASPDGQLGCTLEPDRSGARPLPGPPPEPRGEPTVTVIDPEPPATATIEEAPDDDESDDRPVLVSLGVSMLPVEGTPPTGPASLLLGVSERDAHYVLVWREGALPHRLIQADAPVTDVAWFRGTLVVATDAGLRTWTPGRGDWTPGIGLSGAWTLHSGRGMLIAAGPGGLQVSVRPDRPWVPLPVGGPVSADGRAVGLIGPAGTDLLAQVDGDDVTLVACSVRGASCSRRWTLGPGVGCGITGPVAAAAMRQDQHHVLAHPLRAGVPQGTERTDAGTPCGAWLHHPTLGALPIGPEAGFTSEISGIGPLPVALLAHSLTLHDTRSRGEPDLFGAAFAFLVRAVPGSDQPGEAVLQLPAGAAITVVRPGP
ncbi:MAG: hypothetical protein ACI8PZ_004910 [Myxococcota bacterium]|jgi:hypothetical protein